MEATPGTYGDAEVPLLSELVAGVPGPAVYILDRNFNAYGQLWRLQDEHADAEGVVHAAWPRDGAASRGSVQVWSSTRCRGQHRLGGPNRYNAPRPQPG